MAVSSHHDRKQFGGRTIMYSILWSLSICLALPLCYHQRVDQCKAFDVPLTRVRTVV